MRTRVVIMLSSPSGFINTYWPTREEAEQFIAQWCERHEKRIANGQFQDVETCLYRSKLDNWAVMAQYIIGMYIPDDGTESPQERMAKVMEKMVDQGEDWKE